MRSTLTEANPASPARDSAEATCVVPWRRPRLSRTWGTMDCTPNDTRVTPAWRQRAKRGAEASSGLHSAVTSASGARTTASRIVPSSSPGRRDGVPPPT